MTSRLGAMAASLLAEGVIDSAVDYLKHHDSETTRRDYLRAHRDVLVTALNNQRDCLLAYFEYRFDERREALDQFYNLLHSAIEENDIAQLQASLAGILGIIQDNPLADLAEFRVQWNDPDFTIQL